MTDIVLVSVIGGTFGVIGIAMQTYVTVYLKKIEKKGDKRSEDVKELKGAVQVIHSQMNGMKDDLVRKAEIAGEERGKRMGRDEVLRDLSDEKPFVIFLDDNQDDLQMIAGEMERVGIKKYFLYNDYTEFLNKLTHICSVYVIDKGLPGSSGLAIISRIMIRNPNNYIILLTGDMDAESQRACQNAGATKTVIKNSENSYLTELSRYVDEGIKAVKLRR